MHACGAIMGTHVAVLAFVNGLLEGHWLRWGIYKKSECMKSLGRGSIAEPGSVFGVLKSHLAAQWFAIILCAAL